jgi:uncharacterized repeat protein (TIGR01451 family)
MKRKNSPSLTSSRWCFYTFCNFNLQPTFKSFLLVLIIFSLICPPTQTSARTPDVPRVEADHKVISRRPVNVGTTLINAPPAAPPIFAPLSSTTIYTSYGASITTAKNLGTLNVTTGGNAALFTTSAVGYTAALGYNPSDNKLYYADRSVGPNSFRRYDGTTESAALGTFTSTTTGNPIIRMAFAGGTGYGINSGNLYTFNSASTGAIAISSAITFVGTSPSGTNASGDLAFDLAGHAWAIFGNSLYRLDLGVVPPRAYPIAQISVGGVPLATASFTVAGAAFDTDNSLYIAAVDAVGLASTNIYKVNVANATATLVGSPATVITDLTSGITPDLNPVISAIKTVSPTGNAKPGETLTYTVEIENTGNVPTVASTFIDALPTGTTYVASSATLNGTSLGAATYPFGAATTINGRNSTAGSIMVGFANRATITYQVTVNTTSPPTTVNNQGTIQFLDGPVAGVATKPSPATSGATITNIDSPVSGYKSVKLTTDADSSGSITPGDTVTWTLSYKNSSALTISNFQINDPLPGGVTISATGGQTVTVSGAGTAATKNISYTGATLAISDLLTAGAVLDNSGVITVNIPVTVNTGFGGTLSNQANATGSAIPGSGTKTDNVDNTTSGLPAGVTVPAGSIAQTAGAGIDPTTATVANSPNVTLVKSVTPTGDQVPGTDLTYKIIYTNDGNFAAQQMVVTDPIPVSTDFKVGSQTSTPGTTGLTLVAEFSDDYTVGSPGTATWTYTPVSGGGGASTNNDRNVKAVRWRVTAGNLSQTPPNNFGDVGFIVKIR